MRCGDPRLLDVGTSWYLEIDSKSSIDALLLSFFLVTRHNEKRVRGHHNETLDILLHGELMEVQIRNGKNETFLTNVY